jgi:pimeloyl-ACP methyl ester carboxylesterase
MASSKVNSESFTPPSSLLSATELPRATWDAQTFFYSWPYLQSAPRGDGQQVLIIPGFTANDSTTKVLRSYLKHLGHVPLGWDQGTNMGFKKKTFESLISHLEQLLDTHDEKISLIGQSLGGIMARELSKLFPERIRQVITLGSPFADSKGTGSVLKGLYDYFNPPEAETKSDQTRQITSQLYKCTSVPLTAIYSKFDGIVNWRSCTQRQGHVQVENIDVGGSHSGMGVNPRALYAIADRLAQPEDDYKPFRRGMWRKYVYPKPIKCELSN